MPESPSNVHLAEETEQRDQHLLTIQLHNCITPGRLQDEATFGPSTLHAASTRQKSLDETQ
jgi:hypothetical protein